MLEFRAGEAMCCQLCTDAVYLYIIIAFVYRVFDEGFYAAVLPYGAIILKYISKNMLF